VDGGKSRIPTANIGAFKQRLYCANNIDEIPLNTRKKQSKQLKARANLQTSNVTQTVLQTARDTCQGSPCGCRSTEHPNQSHLKIEQLQVPEKASSAPKSWSEPIAINATPTNAAAL
jgi:hypothetical protein